MSKKKDYMVGDRFELEGAGKGDKSRRDPSVELPSIFNKCYFCCKKATGLYKGEKACDKHKDTRACFVCKVEIPKVPNATFSYKICQTCKNRSSELPEKISKT